MESDWLKVEVNIEYEKKAIDEKSHNNTYFYTGKTAAGSGKNPWRK
jgi:hypothetical protein